MAFILFLISGLLGGVLGGMGMGGGTVLIPLLTMFCGVQQHTAQALNLVSFLPMAIVALIIHFRNGFVNFNHSVLIIITGVVTCILGCYVARAINGQLLKRFFGGFLLILSCWQIVNFIRKKPN